MDWVYNVPIKFFQYDLNDFRNRLSEYNDSNALLIASKRLIKNFEIDTGGFQLIDESLANPDVKLVERILNDIEKPDLIIAIGGGSSIDLGKAISAMYKYKDKNVLDLLKSKKYLENTDSIDLIAVPTTAGTGSECTKWATVWDFNEYQKYSVDADFLYPDESWLVADLTATMSEKMTLETGFDALAHAMESYWSVPSNSFTRVLARDAIRIIHRYLPMALDDLDNREYRKQMLMGSFFAGLAFSNTRTTACHSISYPLTMMYGISHGAAAALTLCEVMRRNWDYIKEKELFLDAFDADSPEDIQIWFDELSNGSLKLSNFSIERDDIPNIVKLATTGGRMDNNPVMFSEDEIEEILNSVF